MNYTNERIIETKYTNSISGFVAFSLTKSIWFSTMLIGSLFAILYFFTWQSFLFFSATTAVSLCLGHSLGMHRKLIHQSYQCPKWLEYIFVHFGVLVGLAGPKGMMHTHDLRDWAQRQNQCHDYFAHRQPKIIDFYWQVYCDIKLTSPPQFKPESSFSNDRIYQIMEKYWMLNQLPWAILFYYFGGIDWVLWGICMRVTVSVFGHWCIGYFAHNTGIQHWEVTGATVQGYNIPFTAFLTMGESYHNNHHAFPNSSKFSLNKNEIDLGWYVLKCLNKINLAWELKTPLDLPKRSELKKLV